MEKKIRCFSYLWCVYSVLTYLSVENLDSLSKHDHKISTMTTLIKQASNEMGQFLEERFDWQIFAVFTTEYMLSKKSARRLAENLCKVVQKRLLSTDLISFWIAEPGLFENDYHLHILFSADENLDVLTKIIADSWLMVSRTKKVKAQNRFTVKPYDKEKRGGNYLIKRMTQEAVDYDFFLPER